MDDRQAAALLCRFQSSRAQEAWVEFLQLYAPLIFQVVRLSEQDSDAAADCFLFVCEHLSRKRFRRLRRFRPSGPASFATWLRAVVRRLYLDWHRKEFGRQRIFQSLQSLSALEQGIFRCVYEQGASLEEAFMQLRGRYPGLTREQIAASWERIQQSLTPRQRFLVGVRRPKVEPLVTAEAAAEGGLERRLADSGPDPESLAALEEQRTALTRALSRLPAPDRLLIRLRFEHELTLEEVGRITKSGDAQSVDRRIRGILERLRKEMP
jgi:RNA polymerase sigma factor (sigma-70 family)